MHIAATRKAWTQWPILWSVLCFVVALAGGAPAGAQTLPHYKLDANWPKPLPNNWMAATFTGMVVDKNDHIWVSQRPNGLAADDAEAAATPPSAECCVPAPPILGFDAQGNLLKAWGGPKVAPDWPILKQGLFIDKGGNFWITGSFQGGGNPKPFAQLPGWVGPKPKQLLDDRQVLKLSPDGKLLLQIGHPSNAPANNQDPAVGLGADVYVDDAAHEAYIADGYLNRRVAVYDSETGAFKRGWGAYGMPLSEIDNDEPARYDPAVAPKQFVGPVISIDMSADGLLYVCDRGADRLQVFQKDGKFVKEFRIHPQTLNNGSCWSTAFSRDPKQKYLYVVDGENGAIWILNREDGIEAGRIGRKGRQPGEFDRIKRMAFDSHGNLYTAEVGHNIRIQKFVPEK